MRTFFIVCLCLLYLCCQINLIDLNVHLFQHLIRSRIFQSCTGPPLNFKFLDDQNQHSATAAADAAAGSVNELNEDVVVVIIQSSSNHSVGNDTDARHSRSFASIDRHYCTATITQMHRVESEIMHMKQCFLSVNDK